MSKEEFSLKLNDCYNELIYVMYYMKGYEANKTRKRSNISGHLYSIYELCVNNWNLVFALSREDLCLVLNCFKLIRSENLFIMSLIDIKKWNELEENYTNSR